MSGRNSNNVQYNNSYNNRQLSSNFQYITNNTNNLIPRFNSSYIVSSVQNTSGYYTSTVQQGRFYTR